MKHTFNLTPRHIVFLLQDQCHTFVQTATKRLVIAYLPKNYNHFVEKGYFMKKNKIQGDKV